ncbi:MAG: histidine kinase N-terminal 7TM domain-containing protein, partial [Candidatus Pacebacteria bacterium]|nr:histidine kinase N-terminal 7TM domain-containing protein [Candidatus Paceibacterota bacterium]
MDYNFITNIESCHTEIPSLLFYSHIPTAVIALFFAFFILIKNKENVLAGKILFSICFTFFAWILIEGTIWLLYSSVMMMFLWSFLAILYTLIHILSLYFVYVFIDKKDISINKKIIFAVLLLPIIIFMSTKYNLTGFDIDNCQAIEGNYFIIYKYFVGAVSIIWIFSLLFSRYRKAVGEYKKEIVLLGIGILLFLSLFSWSEISGSISQNFNITQYGLFGMPILIGFLAYLVVKFRIFNIKLIGAQALVFSLIGLIGAEFFFTQNITSRILTAITLLITILMGINLIRSVKKEVKARETIEKQEKELEIANDQQVTLIHFITHQVKGFLTNSRNVFSMMLDGDFGEISDQVRKMATQGLESGTKGVNTVSDILNAANIKTGKMGYIMTEMDLKPLVESACSELEEMAEKKGLKLVLNLPS